MIDEIESNNIKYQLTPSGNHSRNAAERAIQTFKHHFIAGLSSVHPAFPLRLWDKLIPQAVITLNLLRPSRLNPNLSAYSQLYGHYDYSSHPFAPPGIRILIHCLPAQRRSWDPHATEGYYLGPSLQHYRCYRVWNKASNAERVAQTVRWMPHNSISIPTPTPDDYLRASIQDFIQTVRSIRPQQLPHLNSSSIDLINRLKSIFTPVPISATSSIVATSMPTHHPARLQVSTVAMGAQLFIGFHHILALNLLPFLFCCIVIFCNRILSKSLCIHQDSTFTGRVIYDYKI